MKKIIGLCVGILVLSLVCLSVSLFVIGEPVDGKQLAYTASVDGYTMKLQISAVEPAVALRGWKTERNGAILSISARKVLVSPLFPSGSFETTIDLDGVTSICLGGRIIWQRQS